MISRRSFLTWLGLAPVAAAVAVPAVKSVTVEGGLSSAGDHSAIVELSLVDGRDEMLGVTTIEDAARISQYQMRRFIEALNEELAPYSVREVL